VLTEKRKVVTVLPATVAQPAITWIDAIQERATALAS
jgi:hypothetical protein